MILTHIKAEEIKTWERTKGTIESIYSQYASSPTVAGADDWGKKKTSIKYSYQIQGAKYSGNKAILLDYIYFPETLLTKLSPGEVNVHFNPESPSQSIISIQYPSVAMTMLALSATGLLSIALWLNRIINFLYKVLTSLRL